MLLRPSNFLLLDEPTNHLDMRAKDVLLNSLQEFTGTVVFVSHDRYFIDKVATKVYEIGDGRVEVFPGNYEDYLWRKENRDVESARETVARATEAQLSEPAAEGAEAKQKRINPMRLKQMQDRCGAIEEQVGKLEAEIAEHERALAVFVNIEETMRTQGLMEARRAELTALLEEWEELAQSIEAAG
jgi:ATP-binding cassette, subfamily F, member 3